MLLGILYERNCLAARHLAKAGITLKSARRVVTENKSSRPDYGLVPTGWGQSLRERAKLKWRKWMYHSD